VLTASLLALGGISYVWVPEWLTNEHRFDKSDQYFTFLAATRASTATALGAAITLMGATAAFVTVFATYRTYRAAQDKHASDVLAKATEMLSSTDVSIRLGGVYALRRLAKTSPDDYVPVFDILTGFVRTKYPVSAEPITESETKPGSSRCPVDVHAVLNTIGERCWKKKEDASERHDLSYARFEDAWCVRCDFSRMYFWEAHLDAVNFTRADLRASDFTRARLVDCNFEGALMESVVLDGAELVSPHGLTQSMLNHTFGNASTKLPPNLSAPASWSRPRRQP
jgi:hypothetical protein